jgi:hypothetical protein
MFFKRFLKPSLASKQPISVLENARNLIPAPVPHEKPIGLSWSMQIIDKEAEMVAEMYKLRNAEDAVVESENLRGVQDHHKRVEIGKIKKRIAAIQMEVLRLRIKSNALG